MSDKEWKVKSYITICIGNKTEVREIEETRSKNEDWDEKKKSMRSSNILSTRGI